MGVYNTSLSHVGVLGMRWGHHKSKDNITKYNRTIHHPNESVQLHERKTSATAKFLGTIIPSIKTTQKKYKDYDITDNKGNKVGNISTNDDTKKSSNIVWISIKDKHRGTGYAQSAMRQIINDTKDRGFKELTLEVPTTSPDARHVYEKYGFKAGKQISDNNDIWGGLTQMKLKL